MSHVHSIFASYMTSVHILSPNNFILICFDACLFRMGSFHLGGWKSQDIKWLISRDMHKKECWMVRVFACCCCCFNFHNDHLVNIVMKIETTTTSQDIVMKTEITTTCKHAFQPAIRAYHSLFAHTMTVLNAVKSMTLLSDIGLHCLLLPFL